MRRSKKKHKRKLYFFYIYATKNKQNQTKTFLGRKRIKTHKKANTTEHLKDKVSLWITFQTVPVQAPLKISQCKLFC